MKREAINEEERTVELAFSSETPVERFFGNEILDHSAQSVRLGRLQQGGAVLVDHDHTDHVGVVERVSIDDDRKGRVLVRFGRGERANEIFNDIIDGIRRHVSVGYQILNAVVEQRGQDGELDTVRVTDWEPFEVSIVSVPADPNVGIGRSSEPPPKTKSEESNQPSAGFLISDEKVRKMTEENKTQDAPKINVEALQNDAQLAERSRIEKIASAGETFGKQELAREFIKSGKSVDAFRAALLDEVKPAQTTESVADLDMTEKEVREYSILRAVKAAVSGDWSKAGLERECSIAIADKTGRDARGFFVPFNIQARDMTAGVATAGGHLVGTDHLAGSFIDNLRAQSLIGQLGATFLPGLVGNVDIPRKDGSASFYWLAEDADVTNSDAVIGNVPMSPKTVAGSTPMSRRLMKQSSPAIEGLIMSDLIRGAALAIDAAAFAGTGASNQPTGIINQSGVNTQTVADVANVPTFSELVGFETKVAEDNALMGSLSYVTTPTICGGLKTTAKDSGSGIFVMENGQANGYAVNQTTNIPAGTTIFGNFNDVLIGMWGVLDVMPDEAAKAASGGLVLRVFQDVDVAVRHPESFCVSA